MSYFRSYARNKHLYDRILRQMRERIRTRQYVMTIHAEEEMDDDRLTIFDIESVILTGAIIERQKDNQTGEHKYLVKGKILDGHDCVVVGKLGPKRKLVLITAYRE